MGATLQRDSWCLRTKQLRLVPFAKIDDIVDILRKRDVLTTSRAASAIEWLHNEKPLTAEELVDTALVSPASLGFRDGCMFHELNRAAYKHDLSWCPSWTGVYYRMERAGSQKKGELVSVVSRPLPMQGKHCLIAVSNHDNRDKLSLVTKLPHWRIAPNELFLYKKQSQ